MKIRGGGNPYFSSVGQTQKSEKSSSTKATKKASSVQQTEATSAVATADAVALQDGTDSPFYDAMASAGQRLDENDLEEATRTVVIAVIREHFGKKGIPDKEIEEITTAVSSSITADETLRGRLESVLRRINVSRTKPKGK